MLLGFPTGHITAVTQLIERAALYKTLGCKTIELGIYTLQELQLIEDNIDQVVTALSEFAVISVHAPVKDFRYDSSPYSHEFCGRVNRIIGKLKPHIVVVHPQLIDDVNVLASYDWPLGIENMDWRKTTGRFPTELNPWFKRFPKAKMVLDLNHVYTQDRTMALAKDLWDTFHDRIQHIHLSGFIDGQQPHVPFYKSSCDRILESLPTLALPMILEIGIAHTSENDVRREYDYVLS